MFRYSELPPTSPDHVTLTDIAKHSIGMAMRDGDRAQLVSYGLLCAGDLVENIGFETPDELVAVAETAAAWSTDALNRAETDIVRAAITTNELPPIHKEALLSGFQSVLGIYRYTKGFEL
jgi:hypothetical protein